MNRIRAKNSVPEVYVKGSRDFQLLCDLFDIVNSGVKFDIDTITSLSDTQFCRDSMLQLLQHKLGLNLKNNLTDETLRKILKSFPFIVRHKGTLLGIKEMIHLFLNIIHAEGTYRVDIENINDNDDVTTEQMGNYVIVIVTTVESECLRELDILDDLLRYIIPTGYRIDYSLNIKSPKFSINSLVDSTVYVTVVDEFVENRVRSNEDNDYTEEDSYINRSDRNNLHSTGVLVVRTSNTDIPEGNPTLSDKFAEVRPDDNYWYDRTFGEVELRNE